MRRKKKNGFRRIDWGLVLWIFSLALIISLTLYNYHRAVVKNRSLWEEYRKLEMELERSKEEFEKIRGGEE